MGRVQTFTLQMGPHGYHDMDMGDHWWMLAIWMAIVVAILVLGVVGVIALARTSRPAQPQPTVTSARRLLDERLARGEIEIDDYEARRKLLN